MSDSLWPYGLQHTMLPCPSLSPGIFSNSCSLNRWCLPTISSFVVPVSSCPQSFPASWSFPDVKSWLTGIDADAGKNWKQEKKGMTEDEMVGWHHRLNGHEFEQTLEDGKGQRSLACWSPWGPWGPKELVTTEWTTMAFCIRWPKYWHFSFCISPSNEHPGLISFRMDWLDLCTAQVTLKNLLQHHSSKTSILRCSVFFIVQLSHPYMTTGKTIDLTKWTFVSKVMSLLFNMLSRFVDCIH